MRPTHISVNIKIEDFKAWARRRRPRGDRAELREAWEAGSTYATLKIYFETRREADGSRQRSRERASTKPR